MPYLQARMHRRTDRRTDKLIHLLPDAWSSEGQRGWPTKRNFQQRRTEGDTRGQGRGHGTIIVSVWGR